MQFSTVLFATAVSAALTPLCNDPKQVACPVDAQKYLGGWNEIGRTAIIRNTFEKDCDCTTAEYSLKDATNVKVDNRCVNSKNELNSIIGSAEIKAPGQLQVSFTDNKLAQFFMGLGGANYNIKNVWVDEQGNYRRALVTYGKRLPAELQFTWILSRDVDVSDAEVAEYLRYAEASGFTPSTWQRTPCSEAQRVANPAF